MASTNKTIGAVQKAGPAIGAVQKEEAISTIITLIINHMKQQGML